MQHSGIGGFGKWDDVLVFIPRFDYKNGILRSTTLNLMPGTIYAESYTLIKFSLFWNFIFSVLIIIPVLHQPI